MPTSNETRVRNEGFSKMSPTERPAEALGQLRLREAAVVGELERLALVVRELPQRGLDGSAALAQRGLLVGRPAGRVCDHVERLAAAALLSADEIDRAPVDDGENPRARLGALAQKAPRRAPDAQEGLLHGVLGEGPVAQDAQREP